MNILGVSCHYHDSAAALLVDGELVAAADEERFSRIKHDNGFPTRSVEFCLEQGGISIEEVDRVAFYEKPLLKVQRSVAMLSRNFPTTWGMFRSVFGNGLNRQLFTKTYLARKLGIDERKIVFVEHHVSHAASAFFCSPFNEAAVVTIDGVGEWATTTIGHGTASWEDGENNSMPVKWEIRFPHSLGMLYSAFTDFLGFQVNEGEYKVMGLAPYGRPLHVDKVDRVVNVAEDGSYSLNMEYFDFLTSTSRTYSDKFIKLFGQPNRSTEGEISPYYADVAASIQKKVEDIILLIVREARRRTGSNNLCMAGGVALNSVANGRVIDECGFDDVFIQPAAGDNGGALGCALYVEHILLKQPRRFVMEHPYWGTELDAREVKDVMLEVGVEGHEIADGDELIETVAHELAEGKVIGWCQGRFEWGPRALGARSILADPRSESMKGIINEKIKFREPFRPFAPAMPAEEVGMYFGGNAGADSWLGRFMLAVHPFKDGVGSEVMAVNHEGTGRVQAIRRETNQRYYDVVRAFGKLTGVPVILNTSFNLRGEPIVSTGRDALKTFFSSGLDVLVLGNTIIYKGENEHKEAEILQKITSASDGPKAEKEKAKDEFLGLAPHMRYYESMEQRLHPYLGFTSQGDFVSPVVSTDAEGFRVSIGRDGEVTSDTWAKMSRRALFVGGSYAFGVGATSDRFSVPSVLSMETGWNMLNLGIRSGNAIQEVIACLPFINESELVVVCSGNNALLVEIVDEEGPFGRFSPLFSQGVFTELSRLSLRQARMLLRGTKTGRPISADRGSPGGDPTINEDRLKQCMQRAVDMQKRSIVHLQSLCPGRLVYALQPFALCAKPSLSDHERRLFDLMYAAKKNSYELNKIAMEKIWPEFCGLMEEFCLDRGVEVVNLNSRTYHGWSYLDPVHMTDHGYTQAAKYLAEGLA